MSPMNSLSLRSRLVAALAGASLALSGCSAKVQPIDVQVLTQSCLPANGDPAPSPSEGVENWRLRITAPDLTPAIEQVFPAGGAKVEAIPAGTNRVLTLEGFQGDPANGGTLLTRGASAPFDVPNEVDEANAVKVVVVLRPVGKAVAVATQTNGGDCAELEFGRASHTATLLDDGRVLFVGGYQLAAAATTPAAASNPANWTVLDAAEVFDPKSSSIKRVADMRDPAVGVTLETAFHKAFKLPSGKVMVVGGELNRSGARIARGSTVTYDPGSDAWAYGAMVVKSPKFPDGGSSPQPLGYERSRFTGAVDPQGRIVVAGGQRYADVGGTPELVNDVLAYDPSGDKWSQLLSSTGAHLPFQYGRVGHGQVGVLGGKFMVLLGGTDLSGRLGSPNVVAYRMSEGSAVEAEDIFGLAAAWSPVTGGAFAALGTDQLNILGSGGASVTDAGSTLVNDSAVFDASSSLAFVKLANADRKRVGACAVTLPDGRVVTIGGEVPSGTSSPTTGAIDLYRLKEDRTTELLPQGSLVTGRKEHSCTALPDGSVLVAGGVSIDGNKAQVLKTLELFTPTPL